MKNKDDKIQILENINKDQENKINTLEIDNTDLKK